MIRKVFTQLLLALAFAGGALAQPGPPPGLTVGSTPITGGSSGNCLTVVSGRLQATACAVGSVIAPANGGTGTSTVFTTGSIPFTGASGIYTQNNANLFWSNANTRLGIGTASPATQLHIVGKGNSADGIQIDSTTNPQLAINNTAGGASTQSSLMFSKNGTAKWTLENDISGAGTQNFNIFDNAASANRFQIDASGNVSALSGSISSIANVIANSGTGIPAGGITGNGFAFSSTANFGFFYGSGAPTLSAAQGSLYLRSDGVPFYNVNGATTWASLAAGTGTVNGGTANQLAYYATSGAAVSGLTSAASGVLVTNGSSVPSIGTAIPNGVTGTTQTTSDNSTLLATDAFVQAAATAASLISTPIGVCLPYGGAAAPSSSWQLAAGQAISRTTFSGAFAVFASTYGAGDGTTTFNLPDLRGRVVAEADAAGGTPVNRLTTTGLGTAAIPGASGGSQANSGVSTSINSSGSNNINYGTIGGATSGGWSGGAPAQAGGDFTALTTSSISSITTNNVNGTFNISVSGTGTSGAFTVTQPTLVMNYICRVQ